MCGLTENLAPLTSDNLHIRQIKCYCISLVGSLVLHVKVILVFTMRYSSASTRNFHLMKNKYGALKMWDMKMRDMENATQKCRGGKCEQKFRMESHNNVDAAEYIFCSFMHKTRHIVFSAQKISHMTSFKH